MTRPMARILDTQGRHRVDPQQMALFASPAHQGGPYFLSPDFIGPLRINPYRRHVLRMREMWAADAARRAGVAQ